MSGARHHRQAGAGHAEPTHWLLQALLSPSRQLNCVVVPPADVRFEPPSARSFKLQPASQRDARQPNLPLPCLGIAAGSSARRQPQALTAGGSRRLADASGGGMRPPSLQACVRTLEELLELLSGDLEGVLEQAASLNERCHAAMLDCQGLPAGFGATDAERLSLEKCDRLVVAFALLQGAFSSAAHTYFDKQCGGCLCCDHFVLLPNHAGC